MNWLVPQIHPVPNGIGRLIATPEPIDEEGKYCPRCGVWKLFDDYYWVVDLKRPGGGRYLSNCKQCQGAITKKRKEAKK